MAKCRKYRDYWTKHLSLRRQQHAVNSSQQWQHGVWGAGASQLVTTWCFSRRSTRHTILGCDELTVWRVDWHPPPSLATWTNQSFQSISSQEQVVVDLPHRSLYTGTLAVCFNVSMDTSKDANEQTLQLVTAHFRERDRTTSRLHRDIIHASCVWRNMAITTSNCCLYEDTRQYFVYRAVLNAVFVNTQNQHCTMYQQLMTYVLSTQGHVCFYINLHGTRDRLCLTHMPHPSTQMQCILLHVWMPAVI